MTAYDSWWQVPDHLRTRTQLADLDLPREPGGPARAQIDTRNAIGRKDCFELYDARESVPSPASAKQLAAAATRRTSVVRDCADCAAHTESPLTVYAPCPLAEPTPGLGPIRYLCLACLHIARLREEQARWADQRRRAATWARARLDDPATLLIAVTLSVPRVAR